MANLYVRSTDGSNADNGTTWPLAKATIAGVLAVDSPGDTIWVSQVHAESTAASISLDLGSSSAPSRIVCGNDAAEPPTALAATGAVTVTGTSNIVIEGFVYVSGIIFTVGNAAGGGSFTASSIRVAWQMYETCDFIIPSGNTNTASGIVCGLGRIVWKNCRFKFNVSGQGIRCAAGAWLHINGGSIISGGTSPAVFISGYTTNSAANVLVENFDFTNAGSTMDLTVRPPPGSRVVFRNCKLPSGWSGTVITGIPVDASRAEMYNCDDGSTNYKVSIHDYAGTVKSETTIVRTGGASDGTTTISWKMVSTTNARYPTQPLLSPEIVIWNDTTGSSKTVTVEVLHDSATNLKDDEIYLDVNYLGDSSTPLGSFVSDAVANIVTTSADQATSSETWTTTGMTNPNKQKLSVTFTPQKKGFYLCRAVLIKPSYTVYVCPKVAVS